ncbi:MAG: hypothetical protein FVQ83_04280 [Chloroflexi bacterium]|nr:hypothetical protein [Chloroflexota bacterium]
MSIRSKHIDIPQSSAKLETNARWMQTSYVFFERLTRKWWFYLLLLVVPFFILPISTEKGLTGPSDVGPLIWRLGDDWLRRKALFVPYQPFAHLGVVLLIAAVFRWGNKFGRIFSTAIGLHFMSLIYFQAVGVAENYGLVLVIMFTIWFLAAALPFLWEGIINIGDYTFKRLSLWRYWVVPLAILAFWDPDQTWDLDPAMFVYSPSPTAACMMAPIYLAVLSLLYPRVNMVAFRMMSFTSLIFGVLSIAVGIFKEGDDAVYWTLLHMPQILISLYCFVLGLRAPKPEAVVS